MTDSESTIPTITATSSSTASFYSGLTDQKAHKERFSAVLRDLLPREYPVSAATVAGYASRKPVYMVKATQRRYITTALHSMHEELNMLAASTMEGQSIPSPTMAGGFGRWALRTGG